MIETNWLTLAASIVGTGLAVLGGLVHIVWMISRMRTQLDQLINTMERDGKYVWESLDAQAGRINEHETRLVKLETIAGGKK